MLTLELSIHPAQWKHRLAGRLTITMSVRARGGGVGRRDASIDSDTRDICVQRIGSQIDATRPGHRTGFLVNECALEFPGILPPREYTLPNQVREIYFSLYSTSEADPQAIARACLNRVNAILHDHLPQWCNAAEWLVSLCLSPDFVQLVVMLCGPFHDQAKCPRIELAAQD